MFSQLVKLACLLVSIEALSLSYRWRASEPKACFYVPVTDTNVFIQTYYSVTDKSQGGVKSLANMQVIGPYNQQLKDIPNQAHAEFDVKPIAQGEHSLCFSHSGSPSDKTIDLDITFSNQDGTPYSPPKATEVSSVGQVISSTDAATQQLEASINRVNKDLTEISHTLKYLKNREKRNLFTVESNDRTIFWFSLFFTLLVIGMSLCQVAIHRHSFGRSSRSRF